MAGLASGKQDYENFKRPQTVQRLSDYFKCRATADKPTRTALWTGNLNLLLVPNVYRIWWGKSKLPAIQLASSSNCKKRITNLTAMRLNSQVYLVTPKLKTSKIKPKRSELHKFSSFNLKMLGHEGFWTCNEQFVSLKIHKLDGIISLKCLNIERLIIELKTTFVNCGWKPLWRVVSSLQW